MEDYLVGIGKRIKEIRKANQKTISDIALKAGVTSGLISRIENGRTIPSLPVFLKLVEALDTDMRDFFDGIPIGNGAHFLLARKDDSHIIEKEDEAVGFTYNYLFGKSLSSDGFQSVLLEVEPGSKRSKVTTDAFEFKYVLSGECHYVIADEEVVLSEGDSIFFDGRIPHVPINKGRITSKMLVIYFFI
ncbi:MAG: XRE family transcriptional regulator [Bacteroidota bacterium]